MRPRISATSLFHDSIPTDYRGRNRFSISLRHTLVVASAHMHNVPMPEMQILNCRIVLSCRCLRMWFGDVDWGDVLKMVLGDSAPGVDTECI